MKFLLFFLILTIGMTSSFGQSDEYQNSPTNKGTFLLGAGSNFGFLSQNVTINDPFFGERDIQKETSFSVSPRAGYFIIDNLVTGLQVRYRSNKLDFENGGETKTSSILAQSFARYYFLEDNIRPIVYASIGVGSSLTETDSKNRENLFGYEAGVGLVFLFSKHFSVDFTIGYNNLKTSPKDSDFEVETSGVVSAIGFSIYL